MEMLFCYLLCSVSLTMFGYWCREHQEEIKEFFRSLK